MNLNKFNELTFKSDRLLAIGELPGVDLLPVRGPGQCVSLPRLELRNVGVELRHHRLGEQLKAVAADRLSMDRDATRSVPPGDTNPIAVGP